MAKSIISSNQLTNDSNVVDWSEFLMKVAIFVSSFEILTFLKEIQDSVSVSFSRCLYI